MRTANALIVRGIAVIAVVLAVAASIGGAVSKASQPAAAQAATGGPGAQSYLDLARKDCFGTARNTTSKVWFTVADGVLSDTFSPSIQNSNVNTLQ
jgi:glucoamylase